MDMPQIHVLDTNTINKIAAGEVIERPSSAVKELLENALDAGATRVDIEIINGGKTKISIQDNGCGMTHDEALLAIQRHATSKIRNADDLFSIASLGFRGEAVPSIASVSRMTIRTRPSDAPADTAGTELLIEGGTLLKDASTAIPGGTTIIVEDLFYNVPARMKFLKSSATELGHITSIVSKFILSHPHVAMTLRSDTRTIVQSPGSSDNDTDALRTAATIVLGASVAKKMKAFETFSSAGKISGLLAAPSDTKADRAAEFFFANGRSITSSALSRALEEPLRDKIPRGRFPICIMFLSVKPDEIDVNVHPAKREVKFLKQQETFNAVMQAVKNATATFTTSLEAVEITSKDPFIRMQGHHVQISDVRGEGEQAPLLKDDDMRNYVRAQAFAMDASYASAREGLCPVAQVNKTYIVALDGEDLVLVDQHVAHERVLFEQLKSKGPSSEDLQELLLPESIELTPTQYQALVSIKELLLGAGFRWEDFGGTTVLLRSVPACTSRYAPRQVFADIIDEYLANGASFTAERGKEELLKTVACKAAIKAGDILTIDEMRKLLNDLMVTANPQTCPHGRPIVVPITKEELDKKFGR